MAEYQFLRMSSRLLASTLLKRLYPDLINPHQLFNIPPPVILNIRSETAPLGPRQADSYSRGCHAQRDLHRHDPNGDEDDQPRRIDCQIRGWRWERDNGSRTRCVHAVATSFTRRTRSCDLRECVVTAFQVLPAHSVPGS
jgi:hypothetical protein